MSWAKIGVVVAAVLLFSVFNVMRLPITCNQGFNATVGGIPVYLWTKHSCREGERCMIQELKMNSERVRFADFALLYGGCVSSTQQKTFSCSASKSHQFGREISRRVLEEFYEKIFYFTMTLRLDRYPHFFEFFSQGHDSDEFVTGILNFLGSVGYDREELEMPFRMYADLAKAKESSGVSVVMMGGEVLDIMTEVNHATEGLSTSMQDCARNTNQVTNLPLTVSQSIKTVSGVLYPVFKSLHSDPEGIYHAMAKNIRTKDTVPVMEDVRVTLGFLVAVQMFTSTVDLENDEGTHDIIYKVTGDISSRYSAAYPNDTAVSFMKFIIDGFYNITQKNRRCYKQSKDSIRCVVHYMKAVASLPFKFPYSGLHALPHIRKALEKPIRSDTLTSILDRMPEKSIREDGKLIKYILESLPDRSCREYICDEADCNTNAALLRHGEGARLTRNKETATDKVEL